MKHHICIMKYLFIFIFLVAPLKAHAFIDPNVGLAEVKISMECIAITPDYSTAMTKDAFGTDDKSPLFVIKNNCPHDLIIESIKIVSSAEEKDPHIKFVPSPMRQAHFFYTDDGKDDCNAAKKKNGNDAPTYECSRVSIPSAQSIGFNFRYGQNIAVTGTTGNQTFSIEGQLIDKYGKYPLEKSPDGPQ